MNLNILLLKKSCQILNIEFKVIDKNSDFIAINKRGRISYFHGQTTPLNDQMTAKICLDKEFTYNLLSDVINMPKTMGYLDPLVKEPYKDYLHLKSLKEVITDITTRFGNVVIIKPNKKSEGLNVFKCENQKQIYNSLQKIYNKKSFHYDYVAIAQEYINIKEEFRVVVLNKKVELIYKKNIDNATFTGNLSPLHWKNAKAEVITDKNIITKSIEFIEPIYTKLDLNYGGLDIAVDGLNAMYLIEINTNPAFNYFVKDNDQNILLEFYKKLVKSL